MIFIMPKAYHNFQFSTFNFSFGPEAEKRSFTSLDMPHYTLLPSPMQESFPVIAIPTALFFPAW